MKFIKNCIVFLMLLGISFHGKALFAKDVTLDECIKYTLENHPELMVSRKDMQLAVNNYKVIKAARSLQISAVINTYETAKEESKNNTNKVPLQDTDLGLFAGLSAAYTLYSPQQKYKERDARLSIDINKIKEQEKKNNLIFSVKNAYYSYLMAKNYSLLAKQNLDSADFALKTTEKFFKAGVKSFFELSQAKTRYEGIFLEYMKAKNTLHEKKVELYSAMGIDNLKVTIDPVEVDTLPRLKYSVSELFKFANMYNTSLQQLNVNIKKNKVAISLAKSEQYPRVSLGLTAGIRHRTMFNPPGKNNSLSERFSKDNEDDDGKIVDQFIGVGVSLNWPLYTGGAISTKIESMIINYNKILYSKRSALLNIKNQIASQVRSLEEILKQLKLQKLNIENAKKHYILAQKSYKSGAGTQENLVNAEMSLSRAKVSYTQTKYTYLMKLAILSKIIGVNEDGLCKCTK